MTEKKAANNYALFNKYLGKISKETINKFSGLDNIIIFLLELCNCGCVGLAAKKIELSSPFISPLLVHKIINSDRDLSKCVKLAKGYAAEMEIVKAEKVLYELGINGCHKSLVTYLEANSPKYQRSGRNVVRGNKKQTETDDKLSQLKEIDVFEVEAYEAESSDDKAAG
ncbi:hypothetical protein [Rickettsia endosymbiont of Polydrusus tereticollis]|uniref:hypothetical protein n=1 Tax=Rickettsia endosymbiont of Polydrusus tereticollis TaxID=3066251 RepID=UPI003132E8C3